MAIDYRRYRDWAPAIYGLTVLVLLAVYVVGHKSKGAQAWFQVGSYQLEPSEFAKIGLIVALASYCAAAKGRLTAIGPGGGAGPGRHPLRPDLQAARPRDRPGARPPCWWPCCSSGAPPPVTWPCSAVIAVVPRGRRGPLRGPQELPAGPPDLVRQQSRTSPNAALLRSAGRGQRVQPGRVQDHHRRWWASPARASAREPRPTCRTCPSSAPTSSSPPSASSWGWSGRAFSCCCSPS